MQAGLNARTPGWPVILSVLVPFAAGYFLSYLFRAANAVVAPDLVRDIGIDAGQLGLLTAAYLLVVALFQIPLGILLDRYGPRRVQTVLVAIGAVGAAMFATGDSAATLMLARAIIGLGFAGSLMSGFKAVVLWVPEERRPLTNAWVMSSGAIGLLLATAPLELAVTRFGWRSVFLGLGCAAAAISALIYLVVPERAAPGRPGTLREALGEVATIFRDPVFQALVPLLAVTSATHIAIQTLWVGPWLRDVAQLDRIGVADRLFAIAAAFYAGILLSGAVADWFVRRGVSMLDVMLGFLLLFLVAQAGIVLGVACPDLLLWSMFGMTGQAGVLAFPWLASYFGAGLSGRSSTAVNLPMFIAAFLFQYGIGAVIDRFPGTASGGYDPQAYRVAFGGLLLIQLVALVWLIANREIVRGGERRVQQNRRRG